LDRPQPASSQGLRVRAGAPADAPALERVARAAGLDAEAAQFARDLTDASVSIYVAEADGDPVGFLALRITPPPPCVEARRPLQMWRLYLMPAWHGQGVARVLTGRGLVHASARGHDVVWLGTAPDNARALAFYGKCGFREVGMAAMPGAQADHVDRILACVLGADS
jgi:ribosomal protein S18 acetylase RimI-like enzyme